jgi:hypothetical protein
LLQVRQQLSSGAACLSRQNRPLFHNLSKLIGPTTIDVVAHFPMLRLTILSTITRSLASNASPNCLRFRLAATGTLGSGENTWPLKRYSHYARGNVEPKSSLWQGAEPDEICRSLAKVSFGLHKTFGQQSERPKLVGIRPGLNATSSQPIDRGKDGLAHATTSNVADIAQGGFCVTKTL